MTNTAHVTLKAITGRLFIAWAVMLLLSAAFWWTQDFYNFSPAASNSVENKIAIVVETALGPMARS